MTIMRHSIATCMTCCTMHREKKIKTRIKDMGLLNALKTKGFRRIQLFSELSSLDKKIVFILSYDLTSIGWYPGDHKNGHH